jgi:hypothetical protein
MIGHRSTLEICLPPLIRSTRDLASVSRFVIGPKLQPRTTPNANTSAYCECTNIIWGSSDSDANLYAVVHFTAVSAG